jgi:RND family efflux transporter MFP subunit
MTSTSHQDLSSLRIRRDDPPRRSGGRGRWIVFVVVVLAAAIAAAVFLRPRVPVVQTGFAESSGGSVTAGGNISANGYVVARTKASVSAKVPGRLAYLGVTEGSKVKRGEVIARIENADYAASLEAARAAADQTEVQLAQAERDRERAQALRRDSVIPETQLEDALTRRDALKAQLAADRARSNLAAATLENTLVRAPFDGTVLRKDAEVGEIVAPSSAGGGLTRTAIVTMADLATLEVEVDVNEAYIARVKNAQPAAITLDAYPDTSFRGRVRQVVPTADRQKATVQVKVSILDRDPRILTEMGAKVEFLREEETTKDGVAAIRRIMVPAAAVQESPEGAHVWVVAEGAVQRTNVELGPARGDRTEVRTGLLGGEEVVLNPPPGLKNGTKVKVQPKSS